MNGTWDCIVIGAGAAGLSAALVLGRARRPTLLVEPASRATWPPRASAASSAPTAWLPPTFYERSRAGLEKYPAVSFRAGSIVDGRDTGDGFELDDRGRRAGQRPHASCSRPEWSTGRRDVPGIDERWGRSVFHCPFCHGWEVRDGALGVLDSGESGVHRALLLRSWSDDVTLYTNGDGDSTTAPRRRRLGRRRASRRRSRGARALRRRRRARRDPLPGRLGAARATGLLVPVTLHQRSELATRLGATLAEPSPLAADAVAVDGMGATTVPGLFAAGDMNGRMPSVANAVASGSNAAAAIVQRLTAQPPSS